MYIHDNKGCLMLYANFGGAVTSLFMILMFDRLDWWYKYLCCMMLFYAIWWYYIYRSARIWGSKTIDIAPKKMIKLFKTWFIPDFFLSWIHQVYNEDTCITRYISTFMAPILQQLFREFSHQYIIMRDMINFRVCHIILKKSVQQNRDLYKLAGTHILLSKIFFFLDSDYSCGWSGSNLLKFDPAWNGIWCIKF